ncbi:MAG: DUF1844 domain-containing protein [Verrucomicrobiota bacterium]
MAEENKEKDKGFRVIDRRGREEPAPAPAETPPPAAATAADPGGAGSPTSPPQASEAASGNPGAAEGVQRDKGRGERTSPLGVPRFLDLVESLQMGAMASLGMLQGPDGKRSPVNLPGAKDAIDLLGILQEKTRGNLEKEEEEVLREGLYHLRMAYMAMLNAPPGGRGKGGDKK